MENRESAFLGVKLDRRIEGDFGAGYVVSLVPYEETTTYKKGTKKAPDAIVAASQHIELFDESLQIDASTQGIITVRPKITGLASISSHVKELRKKHESSLLIFLGGEHSITPAIIAGLEEDVGIVWIDAHSDLRSEYLGRMDNHACAARNCLEFGRIVQIGVRSLAEEEHKFLLHTDRVSKHRVWSRQAEKEILNLPEKVYLSIDVDGIDPTIIRAVGTPEPGGLDWAEVLSIVDFISKKKKLLAVDLVELCPSPEDIVSEYTAARLVYKVISHHALYGMGK